MPELDGIDPLFPVNVPSNQSRKNMKNKCRRWFADKSVESFGIMRRMLSIAKQNIRSLGNTEIILDFGWIFHGFPWIAQLIRSLSDPPSEPSSSSQPVGPALAVVGHSARAETGWQELRFNWAKRTSILSISEYGNKTSGCRPKNHKKPELRPRQGSKVR